MSLYRPNLRLLDLVAKFAGVNLRQTRCVLQYWGGNPSWAARLPDEDMRTLASIYEVPITQSSKVSEAVLRLHRHYEKDGDMFFSLLSERLCGEDIPTPEQVVACHQEYQEIVRASGG